MQLFNSLHLKIENTCVYSMPILSQSQNWLALTELIWIQLQCCTVVVFIPRGQQLVFAYNYDTSKKMANKCPGNYTDDLTIAYEYRQTFA